MTKKEFKTLKVGDEVTLKSGLKVGKYYGWTTLFGSMVFEGSATITDMMPYHGELTCELNHEFMYSYQMLCKI